MMPRYGFARAAVWFLELLGGLAAACAVVVAALVGLLRPDLADPVIAAIWGMAGLLAGLAAVALAQMVRAMIDTAENTAELVRLMKRGAPVATPAPVAALVAEKPEPVVVRAAPAQPAVRSEPPLTRPRAAG